MSGSMNKKMSSMGKTRAEAAKEVNLPEGAQVYIFSGKKNSDDLRKVTPYGSTLLHSSLDELVTKVARDSSRVHVFTDGVNTKAGPIYNVIIKHARQKILKFWLLPIKFHKIKSISFRNYQRKPVVTLL